MQTTIDGYVAAPDNGMDWMLPSHDEWEDMFKDLQQADTFLLGRKAYPEYSKHWQSVLKNNAADPDEYTFAKLADKTRHIVFTKSNFKPDWENTKVAHDIAAEVSRLKKEDGKNIIAWGGATFAANLIELGLVDEYRLVINPTILTKGKSLFSNLGQRKNLKLTDAKKVEPGVIITRYQPKNLLT